jgi:hypothetical protein
MVEIDARRTNHPYAVTAVEDAPDPLLDLIRQNLPAGEGWRLCSLILQRCMRAVIARI